jgi:hypothetical protein
MAKTIGRIDRTGVIQFGDASICICEEGISAAREAGGYPAAKAWEAQFNRDVFRRMRQLMRKLGWQLEPMNYIFNGPGSRYCRKGALRGDLIASGRTVKLEMFQNVNAPKRPDHGGRYEWDKESLMTYTMRLEMERTRRRLRDYLLNVFTGYSFKPSAGTLGGHVGGLTALQWVEQKYRESWHFKGDWDSYLAKNNGLPYNRKSADGAQLVHGQRVWFADWRGRIVSGIAMYNINNMWWVLTGRFDVRNQASFEIYTACPPNLRVKRNERQCGAKLKKLLQEAIAAQNFERAIVLRNILNSPAIDAVMVPAVLQGVAA